MSRLFLLFCTCIASMFHNSWSRVFHPLYDGPVFSSPAFSVAPVRCLRINADDLFNNCQYHNGANGYLLIQKLLGLLHFTSLSLFQYLCGTDIGFVRIYNTTRIKSHDTTISYIEPRKCALRFSHDFRHRLVVVNWHEAGKIVLFVDYRTDRSCTL